MYECDLIFIYTMGNKKQRTENLKRNPLNVLRLREYDDVYLICTYIQNPTYE